MDGKQLKIINPALQDLKRLEVIQGFNDKLVINRDLFRVDIIVYPNWGKKILFRLINGFNCEEVKKCKEDRIYYLSVFEATTKARIKAEIIRILLIEMNKTGIKNNNAH
ncbi:MAG: hypothetical protein NTU58_01175 [Candidatus Nealsonbacteria bacterium]|nr:hypothetical protein [Candidatus Nealsonbacteria bacterium]